MLHYNAPNASPTAGPFRTREGSALAAVLAEAVYFQRLRLRTEAKLLGLRLDQLRHALVAHFLRAGAAIADKERHLMRFRRMVAGNEGIDGFQLVDETVLEQE